MRLIWNERARRDVLETASYIAADNPTAAKKWVERIRQHAKQAVNFPQSGRPIPEFPQKNWLELIDGNYRIVYKVHDDAIEIMTVFERHRRAPNMDE